MGNDNKTASGFYATVELNTNIAKKKGWISQEELENCKKMSRFGISPKIYHLSYDPKVYKIEPEYDPNVFYKGEYLMDNLSHYGFMSKHADEEYGFWGEREQEKAFRALVRTHNQGIAHCDLHSRNVFFHPDTGGVKFIDWGFSKSSYFRVLRELLDMLILALPGKLDPKIFGTKVGYPYYPPVNFFTQTEEVLVDTANVLMSELEKINYWEEVKEWPGEIHDILEARDIVSEVYYWHLLPNA